MLYGPPWTETAHRRPLLAPARCAAGDGEQVKFFTTSTNQYHGFRARSRGWVHLGRPALTAEIEKNHADGSENVADKNIVVPKV